MSLSHHSTPTGREGFPRVSGDEPGNDAAHVNGAPFSPRERG